MKFFGLLDHFPHLLLGIDLDLHLLLVGRWVIPQRLQSTFDFLVRVLQPHVLVHILWQVIISLSLLLIGRLLILMIH